MAKAQRSPVRRNVVPDRLDLRDRVYLPAIAAAPPPSMKPRIALPVLNQERTNACTGFALASVVNFLLRTRAPKAPPVSPFMLYSMARRYDEFPGSTEDAGSSVRGALKGWYKHGACRLDLWKTEAMPPAARTPAKDWWLDAAQRPMGAYYRIETRSVTDLHVALHEVGIVYASAACHEGWMAGFEAKARKGSVWRIPPQAARSHDGGHAFVIVGYDQHGFLVQSSWGKEWGSGGFALLTYEDWLENAMDAWVAQAGVVTDQHLAIAKSVTLRVEGGHVRVAADQVLRDREISPFVIDMENDGQLSNTGTFRTQRGDVEALVTLHAGKAREAFGLKPNEPMDVAIYAHGGLVSEEGAAESAGLWVPDLYDARIFPIFLMWETDLFSTLGNQLKEALEGQRTTGGLLDKLKRWWNERLERALAVPGSSVWDEMKENADRISGHPESGGLLLHAAAETSPWFRKDLVRLHLIGHSAGAIVHSHIVKRLVRLGWTFESLTLLAPAVRLDQFERDVVPHLRSGKVKRLRQFHLTDAVEQADPTCRLILGYTRSLLYLVSRSFEHGVTTPILGLQHVFDAARATWGLDNVEAFSAPSSASTSTTHGGFDDDALTRATVISQLRPGAVP
jgi:hypothetical protein